MAHPTAEELSNVSLACAKLWELDVNRAKLGSELVVDIQRAVKVYSLPRVLSSILILTDKEDGAARKLFKHIDASLFAKPTYKCLKPSAGLIHHRRLSGTSR
jgi:poly(U)-specific endoribonuclease